MAVLPVLVLLVLGLGLELVRVIVTAAALSLLRLPRPTRSGRTMCHLMRVLPPVVPGTRSALVESLRLRRTAELRRSRRRGRVGGATCCTAHPR